MTLNWTLNRKLLLYAVLIAFALKFCTIDESGPRRACAKYGSGPTSYMECDR